MTTIGGSARRFAALAGAAAALLLAACGGGASDGGGGAGPAGGTLSGTATKGAVAGATVTAFELTNGARGAQLGTAQTDARGNFSMQVGTYSGPVLVEMHGGSYTDEATNATMSMGRDDVMTAAMPSFDVSATTPIEVTPLTSMAQAMAQGMTGGMNAAGITAANAAMGSYFSVGDILHTMPMNPLVAGSGTGASQDARNYGMSIAAMSQYAMNVGMTPTSSGMVTAMMGDAADGVMNGMMGSTPVSMGGMGGGMMGGTMRMPATAGTADLAAAMERFVGGGMNRSGVSMADMQPLIDKLGAASGTIR